MRHWLHILLLLLTALAFACAPPLKAILPHNPSVLLHPSTADGSRFGRGGGASLNHRFSYVPDTLGNVQVASGRSGSDARGYA